MAVKPTKPSDYREVTYNIARWQLLKELRWQAEKIMTILEEFHFQPIVHGSIARGDVSKTSDIDIFIG